MLIEVLRTSPGMISGLALLIGFALIASRTWPLAIVGSALILLAFFVPFIHLTLIAPEATNASGSKSIGHEEEPAPPTNDADEPRRRMNAVAEMRQTKLHPENEQELGT